MAVLVVPVLVLASCTGEGGCGVPLSSLPEGGLPSDQTIEGGAQVRVTPAGFDKVESLLTGFVNDSLGGGLCLEDPDYCAADIGDCIQSCPVVIENITMDLAATDANTLHVSIGLDAMATVRATAVCPELVIQAMGTAAEADLPLEIAADSGELVIPSITADSIDVDLSGAQFDNCGIIDEILNLIKNLILPAVEDGIETTLATQLTDIITDLLPDPLGIEGSLDVGALLSEVLPDAKGAIELRVLPGGFVELTGQDQSSGLGLGGIVGVNSDRIPATRAAHTDNEPARCVPALKAPDLGKLLSVDPNERGAFPQVPAGEFLGDPDFDADVVIGLSETSLNLVGHHLVASGALCLDVPPGMLPMFTLGTVGLLVPSLGALGNGTEPLLLVTRPTAPLAFQINDGTDGQPHLVLHLDGFEVDVYAFLFERFIRVFSLNLSAAVGIDLEFATTDTGAAVIMPVLSGLDAEEITVEVVNSAFLGESPEDLASVASTLVAAFLPSVTDALGAIEVPAIAGLTLSELALTTVATDQDRFLVVLAALDTATDTPPGGQNVGMSRVLGADQPAASVRVHTRANLARVTVPPPERIRAALREAPARRTSSGQMPEVVVDVAADNLMGRSAEWTWRLNGGMWRSFTRENPLVIRDPALALQGRHRLEVRARAVGDYRTLDSKSVVIPVTIDSVGPRIHGQQASIQAGRLSVPASDLITPAAALEMAFGTPGQAGPSTAWAPVASGLASSDMKSLTAGGYIAVYARDQAGNVSRLDVAVTSSASRSYDQLAPDRSQGDQLQGGCAASGGNSGGLGMLVLGLACLYLYPVRRRCRRALRVRVRGRHASRAHHLLGLVLASGALLTPGLGCGGSKSEPAPEMPPSEGECVAHDDCHAGCETGKVGFCAQKQCECIADVSPGRIGQYSDMTLGADGEMWISAYNEVYGDLNVARWSGQGPVPDDAWAFVDGVPEGPVVVEGSRVRGGIRSPGDDVGRHTSILTRADGTVMVSYFDPTHGSLKLAVRDDSGWQTHVVDPGQPAVEPGGPSVIVGKYSSITARSDNGRPGIAYLAEITEHSGVRYSELRFASAQSDTPAGPKEWFFYVVEQQTLPALDTQNADPYPIPEGTGLFISSARASDQTPVVTYYDRTNGDLKLARFAVTSGTFAEPEILAGGDGTDAGWQPSVVVDSDNEAHVSYVNRTQGELRYINTRDRKPVVIDDGYGERSIGTSGASGRHRVGDDSSIVLTDIGPVIVYQDATALELRMAYQEAGSFVHFPLAGGNGPAGYGFYNAAAYDGADLIISTWVVDASAGRVQMEVFRKSIAK